MQNQERVNLESAKTCELVNELKKREGVGVALVKPYQDVSVSVDGPAIVLVVVD